jgi:hypothetical protein
MRLTINPMTHQIDKKLQELDLKTESIEKIEKILSESILGHTRPTISTTFEGIFRARKITNANDSEIDYIKSIWHPNWKEISESEYRYNRCSDKGENFFYCSNSLETTIKELEPENGDDILIGIFYPKFATTKVRCQFAGIEELRNNIHYKTVLKNYNYYSKNDKKIEELISSKFKERVSKDESFKYKLTIAFSNILLKNKDIECLIYPSIATKFEFVNFGLKPVFVDEHLYCAEIFQYSVEKTSNEYILTPEKYGEIEHNLQTPKISEIDWKECRNEDKNIKKNFGL